MEDLGHLLSNRALIASSSMSTANGVSIVPDMGQPGSDSEASAGVAPRTPGFDVPEQMGPTTVVDGSDSAPHGGSPYTEGDGHGWHRQAESGIDSGAQAPRDAQGRWTQT